MTPGRGDSQSQKELEGLEETAQGFQKKGYTGVGLGSGVMGKAGQGLGILGKGDGAAANPGRKLLRHH